MTPAVVVWRKKAVTKIQPNSGMTCVTSHNGLLWIDNALVEDIHHLLHNPGETLPEAAHRALAEAAPEPKQPLPDSGKELLVVALASGALLLGLLLARWLL